MFEVLSDRLQGVLKKLRSKGALTEADVDAALREVRLALLEADVGFKVVKSFLERVRVRAVGTEVMQSLTPGQQMVKIVHEELTTLMGVGESRIGFAPHPPTTIMLVGLQGSGKTTACAKLAVTVKGQGRNPLIVAADIYRPAAIDQLIHLGEEVGVPVYSAPAGTSAEAIARGGIKEAERTGRDTVILDTAGRLHIDDEMMAELTNIKSGVRPHEILLVVDAMTGQDAVKVADHFQERLGVDGVIMTKLDGDSRGGAALSVREVTGKPIKLVSESERMVALEPFHAERMASRMLGMGDVLTLIEKAEASVSKERAAEMEEKLRRAEFDLDDFLVQLQELRKMGSVSQLLQMMPGLPGVDMKGLDVSDNDFKRIEAIIQSMTPKERAEPSIITGRRRERIARGSGTGVHDVNQLLKQFAQTRKLLKQMAQGARRGRKGLFPFGG